MMADDELLTIKIVFQPGPGQTICPQEEYTITQSELERLVQEMNVGSEGSGAYDVRSGEEPRKLILRFDQVLYIG